MDFVSIMIISPKHLKTFSINSLRYISYLTDYSKLNEKQRLALIPAFSETLPVDRRH